MRRHTYRQRSGVASQQRLRPRRFDSTVKHVPKLGFEPVSFLFLACLSIKYICYHIGLLEKAMNSSGNARHKGHGASGVAS